MQGKRRKGGWCPTLAPLGSLWPSEACRSCLWPVYPPLGLSSPLTCPDPPHALPSAPVSVPQHRCASGERQCQSSLPCGVDPSQITAPSQCPLISLCQTLGRGPGTACATSSWAILITPAKLCAQEESWSLVCMQEAMVPGCIRGRWAPWESDRADQESNSPSLLRLALLQTSEQMRTGHQGVQAPQSRSGYKSFESSESVSTHSVPCSVQAPRWHQGWQIPPHHVSILSEKKAQHG